VRVTSVIWRGVQYKSPDKRSRSAPLGRLRIELGGKCPTGCQIPRSDRAGWSLDAASIGNLV